MKQTRLYSSNLNMQLSLLIIKSHGKPALLLKALQNVHASWGTYIYNTYLYFYLSELFNFN